MTEEIAAVPGWAEKRLDAIFAALPATAAPAKAEYLECLGGRKAPAAPSDLLGDEFADCRGVLRRALMAAGVPQDAMAELDGPIEALEAEIAAQS